MKRKASEDHDNKALGASANLPLQKCIPRGTLGKANFQNIRSMKNGNWSYASRGTGTQQEGRGRPPFHHRAVVYHGSTSGTSTYAFAPSRQANTNAFLPIPPYIRPGVHVMDLMSNITHHGDGTHELFAALFDDPQHATAARPYVHQGDLRSRAALRLSLCHSLSNFLCVGGHPSPGRPRDRHQSSANEGHVQGTRLRHSSHRQYRSHLKRNHRRRA